MNIHSNYIQIPFFIFGQSADNQLQDITVTLISPGSLGMRELH